MSGGTRSGRFLQVVGDYENVVVVMHDNPDPDAIAAGWALLVLIRKRLERPVRLVAGGGIVRAENCHMVQLLRPPIELVTELDVPATTAAVLVDCSSAAANHLLAKANVRPVAVIDHHISGARAGTQILFRDVRPSVSAAASIAASYLREQGIVPEARLATALSYAIRTETRGSQVRHGRLDRSILRWLADRADPEWIAEIEAAPLPNSYFGDLARALHSAVLYGDVGFCLLPRANGAEIVGEVADLLIRAETLQTVLCAAVVDGDLMVSVRTREGGRDASVLARKTLDGLGGAGGHAQRAGGRVPATALVRFADGELERDLERRWLAVNDIAGRKRQPLVPPVSKSDDVSDDNPSRAR